MPSLSEIKTGRRGVSTRDSHEELGDNETQKELGGPRLA